jgi:hypothetical protein
MKTFLLFTLLFVSNLFFACGFYPYGEDVRFKLMNPLAFGYRDFQLYNYTGYQFYNDPYVGSNAFLSPDSTDLGKVSNAKLWLLNCKQNVSINDVLAAIYGNESVKQLRKSNAFVKDLFERNDKESIRYLEFAKTCAPYNSLSEDPWMLNSRSNFNAAKKMIVTALKQAKLCKREEMKNRYNFLAIRMSYYANDRVNVKALYNSHFASKLGSRNIIDLWALYFRTIVEENPVEKNYLSAIVFKNTPDKRYMSFFEFDTKIDINLVLAKAKNNDEKEAIYFLQAMKTPGKCLDQISAIQGLNPSSRNLAFLLMREVNKLEDWILTPTYTRFFPAAGYQTYYVENQKEDDYLSKRIVEDKKYASELYKILKRVKENDGSDKSTLLSIYLSFLIGNYQETIQLSNNLKQFKENNQLFEQANYIRALALTANQKQNFVILAEVEPILDTAIARQNILFVFALGRELEAKGNTTLAALCYWKIEDMQKTMPELPLVDGGAALTYVSWKAKKRNQNLGSDYYYEYFHYLDAEYSAISIQNLITFFESNEKMGKYLTEFCKGFESELPRLHDLIGTKYMRTNDLSKAELYFSKAGEKYYENDVFAKYLASNPFYTNMYNEHGKVEQDNRVYSKIGIVKALNEWIKKSKNETNSAKDVASFTVANCYLNMTQYGNSWMMKRYFWTSNANETQLEDDEEYFKCLKAKEYYLKAASQTKRVKFKALCIRMAGRCESYKLWRETDFTALESSGEDVDYNAHIFKKNKFYQQIKKEHSGYYDDLISNCLSFEDYYSSTK